MIWSHYLPQVRDMLFNLQDRIDRNEMIAVHPQIYDVRELDRFDMTHFFVRGYCRTVGCVAGWAVELLAPELGELSVKSVCERLVYSEEYLATLTGAVREAQKVQVYAWVFSETWKGSGPLDAVRRIDYLVNIGPEALNLATRAMYWRETMWEKIKDEVVSRGARPPFERFTVPPAGQDQLGTDAVG